MSFLNLAKRRQPYEERKSNGVEETREVITFVYDSQRHKSKNYFKAATSLKKKWRRKVSI